MSSFAKVELHFVGLGSDFDLNLFFQARGSVLFGFLRNLNPWIFNDHDRDRMSADHVSIFYALCREYEPSIFVSKTGGRFSGHAFVSEIHRFGRKNDLNPLDRLPIAGEGSADGNGSVIARIATASQAG